MTAISIAAPNFTLAEFEAASAVTFVPLSQQMRDHAVWHSLRLQAVRDALNATWSPPVFGADWRIGITSYVRSGGGDHATGAGVDWNVRDHEGKRNDALTKWARDWLALHRKDDFAELIFEPPFGPEDGNSFAHVHHARRGFSVDASANETPQILDEIEPGRFVAAVVESIPKPLRPIAMGVAVFGALVLLDGIAGGL